MYVVKFSGGTITGYLLENDPDTSTFDATEHKADATVYATSELAEASIEQHKVRGLAQVEAL